MNCNFCCAIWRPIVHKKVRHHETVTFIWIERQFELFKFALQSHSINSFQDTWLHKINKKKFKNITTFRIVFEGSIISTTTIMHVVEIQRLNIILAIFHSINYRSRKKNESDGATITIFSSRKQFKKKKKANQNRHFKRILWYHNM